MAYGQTEFVAHITGTMSFLEGYCNASECHFYLTALATSQYLPTEDVDDSFWATIETRVIERKFSALGELRIANTSDMVENSSQGTTFGCASYKACKMQTVTTPCCFSVVRFRLVISLVWHIVLEQPIASGFWETERAEIKVVQSIVKICEVRRKSI